MKYKLTCVQFCSKCFINYKYKQNKISIVSCRSLPLAKQTETRKNTKSATLTSKILSDKNTDINKYINNKRGTLGSWITSLITKWVPLKRPFSYSQKTLQGSSLHSRLTPRPKPRFTFPTKKTKAFATLERALEPKCVPQLFLGSLLWTRWSSVSHFFYLSLVTIPEVFAKVNSTQFPSRF